MRASGVARERDLSEGHGEAQRDQRRGDEHGVFAPAGAGEHRQGALAKGRAPRGAQVAARERRGVVTAPREQPPDGRRRASAGDEEQPQGHEQDHPRGHEVGRHAAGDLGEGDGVFVDGLAAAHREQRAVGAVHRAKVSEREQGHAVEAQQHVAVGEPRALGVGARGDLIHLQTALGGVRGGEVDAEALEHPLGLGAGGELARERARPRGEQVERGAAERAGRGEHGPLLGLDAQARAAAGAVERQRRVAHVVAGLALPRAARERAEVLGLQKDLQPRAALDAQHVPRAVGVGPRAVAQVDPADGVLGGVDEGERHGAGTHPSPGPREGARDAQGDAANVLRQRQAARLKHQPLARFDGARREVGEREDLVRGLGLTRREGHERAEREGDETHGAERYRSAAQRGKKTSDPDPGARR
jgi:hypothetical protein